MNPRERFKQGFVRYPPREQCQPETPKDSQGSKDWTEHPKLIKSEIVSRKRSLSPVSRYDDPVDSKVFVHKLLSENDVYTQDFSSVPKKTSLLPDTPFKIGIEDLESPRKPRGSKTPKKTCGQRNSVDTAIKQIHQKRDAMFGGLNSQTARRIALPSSQSTTPCSMMLHPTFQSLQIGNLKGSPLTPEPVTCDKPTPHSSNILTRNLWSSELPQAFNFECKKLPQPGSYSSGRLNIFSQSVRRENKHLEPGQFVTPVCSSPAAHTGSEKSSSFGTEQFSPILGSLHDKASFLSQDSKRGGHSSMQQSQPFSLQPDHFWQEQSRDDSHHQTNNLVQSLDNTPFSQQPVFPQFLQVNSLAPKKASPQVDESWTQFTSRYQNARKRPRNSSYYIPKPLSYSDDEDEKPKSLWSLIEESPKRKQCVLPKTPVSTLDITPKDLYDSNSWFHSSPLFTSTPVKDLIQEEMNQSPVHKQTRRFDKLATENPKVNLNDSQRDVNEVLTESCFITPRASSIPKFRSLCNTLTPESFAKDSTTDMTNYCDETLDTSERDTSIEPPNSCNASTKNPSNAAVAVTGDDMLTAETLNSVTPKKITSRQITDFFQRVEAKAKTSPPPISVIRQQGKKTPSFTPYLSPIEETSTDMSHDKVLEKKIEPNVSVVEEE